MQLGDEIENLLVIGRIVSRRLVQTEIPRFIERRAERYAVLIQEFGAAASMEFEEVIPYLDAQKWPYYRHQDKGKRQS